MTSKYGTAYKLMVLSLQAYKAMIQVAEDLSQTPGENGLTDAFMERINDEFFSQGDKVDSYIERLFDCIDMPKNDVLRNHCGILVLLYLGDKANIVETIRTVFAFKAAFIKDPQAFLDGLA